VEGDYYLKHVDAFKAKPASANVFFDYGYSIVLDDDYEGGEFVLDTDVVEVSYTIKKGQILIFPIIHPHSVNKVTLGYKNQHYPNSPQVLTQKKLKGNFSYWQYFCD